MYYKIEISPEDLKVIFLGLGELPIKIGVNVLSSIQRQKLAQDQPSDAAENGAAE